MALIVPDADIYGKFARVSAVADYLELLALKGTQLSKELLADVIADNEWTLEEPISGTAADAAPPDDDPLDAADRVFAMIGERIELLGDIYPFELWHSRLRLKGAFDINHSSYIALLAITVAHAYEIQCPGLPYQIFEETVSSVVAAKGLLTANVGTVARHASNFEETLETVAGTVSLRALRDAAPTYTYAQDERIDTLCHLSWGDNRPGAWTMLGQATCAKSESWDKKVCEPPAGNWGKLLGVGVRPQVFLAVPHHVSRPMLEKLVSDREHMVLDRLRLARFKTDVLTDEAAVVNAVLACEVEGTL